MFSSFVAQSQTEKEIAKWSEHEHEWPYCRAQAEYATGADAFLQGREYEEQPKGLRHAADGEEEAD
jgi:hypothetical protein